MLVSYWPLASAERVEKKQREAAQNNVFVKHRCISRGSCQKTAVLPTRNALNQTPPCSGLVRGTTDGSGAKTNGNYFNSMMALKEALDHGFDEALMLDIEGFVSEGSGENIFVIKDEVIYTPNLTSALPGITRSTIVTLAKSLGYEVVEKKLSCDNIYASDEAFFTGTAAEVTPIRDLDGNQIGNGSRGPITEKLQSLYFDCVHGRNADYLHWINSGMCQ